jgi:hypothetical protein
VTQTPVFHSSVRTAGQLPFEGFRRPKVVLGGLAIVGASAIIGVAITSHTSPAPSAPTRVAPSEARTIASAPAVSAQTRDNWYLEARPALAAPAVYAQPRDRWYLEPRTAAVPRSQPARVADRWYLETGTALTLAAVSTQARDRWYLEPRPNGAPPMQQRHVIDRWYLDD